MALSLLLHGGVATAVYVLHPLKATRAHLPLKPGELLEIVVGSEPAAEIIRPPAPVVQPTELPAPTPLPKPQPAEIAPPATLPLAKNEVLPVAAPVMVPIPTKTVDLIAAQAAPAPTISQPPTKAGDDVPVNYLLNPKPVYPPAALRRQEEGLVILSVKVEPSGFPSRVQIVQSSRFQELDAAAIVAVRQWQFVPARLGDLPVASQIEVPIRFQLAVPNQSRLNPGKGGH